MTDRESSHLVYSQFTGTQFADTQFHNIQFDEILLSYNKYIKYKIVILHIIVIIIGNKKYK